MAESGRGKQTGEGGEVILEGWTKEEKLELLFALKCYGSKNIDQIQAEIPSKTVEEIKHAVNIYKKKALKQHKQIEKMKKKQIRKRSNPRIPLASWAKFLVDSLGYKDLETETSTALRLIADLEKIPSPLSTENVNFSQIYHQIANAMEGKPLKNDHMVCPILNKCILETALVSKAFIKNSVYKFVVNSINISDREMNLFPQPTHDHELSTLRHLAAQRKYNPLNINESFLSPTLSREFS
ncbi:uncharacterized protein LOC115442530 [Manduca sexta]|uniref:uncharacterized protein LOC115442530 n=1 Tax=Manduca sexta TaxID=7130 RepID=UPI00188E010F|nr:uncharacterized protein LOC115442530 [Manduca sexta]